MAVYFIQCEETKLIKIGYSKRPSGRIKSLRTGAPGELTILKITDGGANLEHDFHERFSGDRTRGEWFRPSSELLAEIECLPQTVIVDNGDYVQYRRRHDATTLTPWLPPNEPEGRPPSRRKLPRRTVPYLDQPQINHLIVEAIIKSNASYTKIAAIHGLTRSRIQQIAARLEREGTLSHLEHLERGTLRPRNWRSWQALRTQVTDTRLLRFSAA